MIEETIEEELSRISEEMKELEEGSVLYTKLQLRKEALEESKALADIPVGGPTGNVCLACEG